MKFDTIPNTSIQVSKLCLGTMTFGEQNSEKEAHEQLNYAFDKGINFIDTAEMYSVPGRKETQGDSERFIGTWLQQRNRTSVIIGTKVTGPYDYFNYLRENLGFSKEVMAEAKGRGYDTKVMRKVIALRKRDANDIAEEEAVLDMYKEALGM